MKMGRSARRSRPAVAGIVATVIMFAILFTVGGSYFIFVQAQNSAYSQSLLTATNKVQGTLQEQLSIATFLETNGDLGFYANNTSSVTVNMTAALVISSAGILLKCDGVGFPAGAGCSNSTPSLWMVVTPGSESSVMDTGYLYVSGTTDTVKVLTARGNAYSATYPTALPQTSSSQSVTVNLDNLKWVQLIPQASSLAQKKYVSNCNAAACAASFTSSVTAGNILVDAVSWPNQAPPSSVPTDSLHDSFTLGASSSVNVASSSSVVQQKYTSNCNAATCGLAFSSNVGSGNTLVYALGWAGQSPPSTPTDTRGDSFTLGSSQSVTVTPPSAALVQDRYLSNCNSATCSLAYTSSVTAGNTLVYGLGWGGFAYVPITITNNQGSATANPFQQMVTWNPSSYSTSEATNLGNIRFCTTSSCTTQLYSWLESCSSTCSSAGSSSTSATAWVKLTSSIAGSGGQLTIYMVFQPTYVTFDGIYWGEAPQLSGTYAQYDNGANVFTNYWNFAGTSCPTGWTCSGTTISNGISAASAASYAYTTATYGLTANMLDFYGGFSAATSVYNAGFGYNHNTPNGNTVMWDINSNTGPAYGCGSTNACLQTSVSGPTYNYLSSLTATGTQVYSIYWGSTASATACYSYTNCGTSSSGIPTAAISLGIYNAQGGQATIGPFDWLRLRVYPPSGTMPSTSFGGFNGAAPTVSDTLGDTFTLGASQSVQGGASPSVVQHKYLSNCNSATCSLAYTSSVTAGNTLVYGLGWYGSNTYVPITITNNQGSATANPFQQMVTWNPSSYSSYEATNLGNVRFCADSACATTLYSWLESCSSACSSAGSSSTSATAWVKLTSSVAGSGGQLTIYMVFQSTSTNFDDLYAGEAPELSSTYAQYDNGANVFTAYFDGNTATSNFAVNTNMAVSKSSGVSGPGGATINAIHFSGYAGSAAEFEFKTALTNAGMIVESSFANANIGTATGVVGLLNNASPGSVNNGINAGDGFGSDFFSNTYYVSGAQTNANNQGTGTTAWEYGSVTYAGTAATSWSAYIAPQLYSTTGGYTGTVSNNPVSAAGNLYMGGGFGSSNGGYTVSLNFDYMRARAYPPSNTMPSVSFGSAAAGGPPSSVTDTLGSSFTLATSNNVVSASVTYYSYIWYATAPSTGADTITATFAASVTGSESVYEISGATPSVSSTGSSSSSQATSSVTSMTPSASNSVVIGNTETTSTSFTAGSGYTLVGTCNSVYGCSEYQTGVGSATTVTTSLSPSAPWVEVAIALAPVTPNYYSYIWYATASGSGADTITATFGGVVAGTESIYEIAGYSTSVVPSSTGTSSLGSTSASVGSFTPSSNSFVVGNVEGVSSTTTFTAGSGFTLSGSCSSVEGCGEYETGLGSATTVSSTLSASTPWVESAISFAPASTVTYYSYIWYGTAASSGADTISATFGSTVAGSISIYELSSVTATGLLSSTGSSSSSQTASAVSSMTPAAGSVVIGEAETTATTYTAGSGYSLSGTCNSVGGCGEYQTGVGSATTVPMSFGAAVPWTEAALAFAATTTNYYSYIWYATAASSGADTVTATFSGTVAGSVSLYEITGFTTSGLLSSTGSSSTASTTSSVAAFTPSSDSFTVGSAEGASGYTTFTATSGFTLVGTCNSVGGCSEYNAGGGGTATTVPITLGTSTASVEAALSFSTPFNPQSGIQVGGYPTMGVPSGASLVWEVTFTNVDPQHRVITVWPQTVLSVGSAEWDGFDTDYMEAHYYIIDGLNPGSTTVTAYTKTSSQFLTLPYDIPTTLYFAATQILGSTTQSFGTNVLTPFEAYFALTGQFSDTSLFGETIPYPYGIITQSNAYTTPTVGGNAATVTVSCTSPCHFGASSSAMVGWINSAGQLTQLTTFTTTAGGNIPAGVTFAVPTAAAGYYTIEVTDYTNSVFMTFQHT